jgi:DNA polymerase
MTWQEILKSVGYPPDVLVLDFESYFDSDYHLGRDKKSLSTIEYITDKRFELLGLGTRIEFGSGTFSDTKFWGPKFLTSKTLGDIETIYGEGDLAGTTVIVQNAFFDITILKEKFGIVPKYIIDIKDLSKHYDARMSHKLEDLAKMYHLKAKEDTKQFSGLHWDTMTVEQRQNLTDYSATDLEIEWELFKILLPLLTNPEIELKLARHTLDLYLNPRIKFDETKANELQAEMNLAMMHSIKKSGYTEEALRGNKSFEEILYNILPIGEIPPTKPGKKGNILALAKDDEGLRYLLNHPDETVRTLVKARQAVKSWPLHIRRIENLVKQATASGGYLRIPLNYYGGHTGRWGGTEKINPQNFGATGRTGRGTHELISKVRELLLAPDNYKFIIIDSAQIEARILAWLAGQEDLLSGFKNEKDIYSEFATLLFGTEVRKSLETDNDTDRKKFTIRRGFGKDAILGCGYGMGGKKFYERCRQNNDLRPLFDSGEYDFNFIDNLIKTYRITYSRIPEFWSLVEKCFKQVIKFPHETICLTTKLEVIKDVFAEDILLSFTNYNGIVNLQLPSGRVLYYRHCRIDNEGSIRWHWGNLWGGSITENIVQAIARDLLGYWILEFEKRRLPVVLHTHDEIVSIIPDTEFNPWFLSMAHSIMCHGPDWAKGLPLAAEGVISDAYKK